MAEEEKTPKAKEKPKAVEVDWNMNPAERLTLEVAACGVTDGLKKAVGEKLLKEFATDDKLAQTYRSRKVSLDNVTSFVTKKASQRLGNKNGHIADEVVFGWAIHYVLDVKEEVSEEPTQKIKLSAEDDEEARKKAMDSVTEEERDRILKDAMKQAMKEARQKVRKEMEEKKAEKAKEAEEKRKAKEAEKAKEAGYEQLGLFDF